MFTKASVGIAAAALLLAVARLKAQTATPAFPVPGQIMTWHEGEVDFAAPAVNLIHIQPGVATTVSAEILQLGTLRALLLIDGCGTGGCDMIFYVKSGETDRVILDGGGAAPYTLPSGGTVPDLIFLGVTKGAHPTVSYSRYRFANGAYSLAACESQSVNAVTGEPGSLQAMACAGSGAATATFPTRGANLDAAAETPAAADLNWIGHAVTARLGPLGNGRDLNFDRGQAIIARDSPQCDPLGNCPVYYWPGDQHYAKPVLLGDRGWGGGWTGSGEFVLAQQLDSRTTELRRERVRAGVVSADACETLDGAVGVLPDTGAAPQPVACH